MEVLHEMGDFEFSHVAGSGTFGSVYKAKQKSSGRVFALKKVNEMSKECGIPLTTYREIHALRVLRHPNILRMDAVLSDEKTKRVFLVFEYCKYSLSDLIYGKLSGVNLSLCCRYIFKQIVHAIAEMHRNKIMHRDIKPSNILITKDGTVKIGDFGLSRTCEHGRFSLNVAALPYRAPECFKGNYNQKMDVWSAACLLYEMLTRKTLFTPKTTDIEMANEIATVCHIDVNSIIGPDENQELDNGHIDSLSSPECKECSDLLESMLCANPIKRVSIFDVEMHPYVAEAKEVRFLP